MNQMLFTIPILLAAGLAGLLTILYSLHRPNTVTMAALAIFVVNAIFLDNLPDISLGAFNVGILDILSIFLIGLGLTRMLLSAGKQIYLPMLVLGLLLGISLVRGINFFGVQSAVNFFRPYLYFFAPLFAIVSFNTHKKTFIQFAHLWGWAAWVLVTLAVIRWVGVAAGLIQDASWIAPSGAMTRVLNASQAFFLLQALILAWNLSNKKNIPLQSSLPYATLITIIFLQHRTVWVALGFLSIVIFLMRRQIRPAFLLFGLFASIIAATLLLLFSDAEILTSLAGSAQNMGNFEWRVEGWQALLEPERFETPLDYLMGQPFGTGYARYLFGSLYVTEYSPHNFYVQTFLNIGATGLLVLLSIYVSTLVRLLRQRQDKIKFAMGLLLISHLLYFITYNPSYEQGLVLGFSILLARKSKQE